MKLYQSLTLFFVGTISFTAFSQSPGGVSGANSVELWLDAAQLNLANGTKVALFTDATGNGNHATASGAERPRYILSDPNFNNQPSIDFDGLGDNLETGSIPNLATTTMSSYVVARANTNHRGVIFRSAYTAGTASGNQYMFGVVKQKSTAVTELQVKKADGSHSKFSTPHNTNAGVYANVWDGTTSFEGFYDGNSLGAPKTNASSNPSGHLGVILGQNYSPSTYPFFGQIAEMFIYSKKINLAERTILDNYVAAKYGISIVNDLYSWDAVHNNDLIGLGREADGSNLTARGASTLTLSIAAIGINEYVFAAHDNGGLTANVVDIPATVFGRYNQVWRADVNGNPGSVDISFDVSNNPLGGNGGYILLLDNDGVFAAGATQVAGVFNAGTVTFSNVNLSSGVYFTLSNNDVTIRSTGNTTDWHLTTTWDCGCIPIPASKVIVEAAHTVDINSQAGFCSDITIDGTLNMNSSDTLYVSNTFINNGTFTAGSGTVSLDGIAAQSLSGTTEFFNLHVNNSNGVANSGTISIQGWLDVEQGSIATGGSLTLLSNASGTGALKNPSTGTISGNVTMERFLNEGEGWYLLAPSVIGGNLEDWNQEFEMQGFTGTEWPGAGFGSVFFYNQNNNVSSFNDGYTEPNSTFDLINFKTGFECYVGDDSYFTGARTIDISGTFALGNQNISAPYIANIGVTSEDGWTLMANPYASPVQWNQVTKSGNFDNAYRRRSNGTDKVMSFNFVLAPGEAFWVHSDPGGSTIQFEPQDVSATNVDNYNLRENNANIIIKMDDGISYDETEIGFSEVASNKRERGIDAYKLYNADKRRPNLSTYMDGAKFRRNILNTEEDIALPLLIETVHFNNEMKNYTLTFDNVFENTLDRKIYIQDIRQNELVEITDELVYEISMSDNEKTPLYRLVVKNNNDDETSVANQLNNSYVSYSSDYIYMNMNNEVSGNYEFTILNSMGKVVMVNSDYLDAYGVYKVKNNLAAGVYLINIKTPQGAYISHKIVISKN